MTDRARRVGSGAVPPPVRPSSRPHPLRPLQGLRGPLRWVWTSPRAVSLGTGITLPVPTTVYPTRVPTLVPTPVHPAECSAHYTYTVLRTVSLSTV